MRLPPLRFLFRLLLVGSAVGWTAVVHARPIAIDLPAQPASAALLAFSQQTQSEVLFSFDELRTVTSTAVHGQHEPEDALSRLLRGTGFMARRNAARKFVVTRIAPASATLRGRVVTTQGAPLAGVEIKISRHRGRIVSEADGTFEIPALPPGAYRLVFNTRGYRTTARSDLVLTAGETRTLEPQVLERDDDLVQLDPYLVEGKKVRANPLDRSGTAPRLAAGNLDLPRTQNDALPYQILDRALINRSGVVNLNEFLQREILDGDTAARPPDQNGNAQSYLTSSSNLNLRGFGDSTVVLVNGRRLPEVLTSYAGVQQADVNVIPLGLVQQVEVLSVSGSALYSGNPVGGVINIVLRKDIDATEVTTTYSNALGGFDAPHSSLSLQHGQTLLDGRLRLRLSANFTDITPPTESELGYRQARVEPPLAFEDALFRATPNVRSADGTPLFASSAATVTSVAPGADGTGGLAAFNGRAGLRNFALFDSPAGLAASLNSLDYPYGRSQQRASYFGSATYDVTPWLQVGVDAFHARTEVTRGLDVLTGDLFLARTSPQNPFGQDVSVSLNEIAPALGADYSQARVESSTAVLGLLVKLPGEWRANVDVQYARNTTQYRGLAGVDLARWQELVDDGRYRLLRDTQLFGPPPVFYDYALIYHGGPGKFVTFGDYQTLDAAVRVGNQQFHLPTGNGALNVGFDYRRNELAPYVEQKRFADGSPAVTPDAWTGRTLERLSVFGELQAPLWPAARLPHGIDSLEGTFAARYIAADTSNETNLAPALGFKADLAGGFSVRGSVTLSSRFPTPDLSRRASTGSGPGGGLNLVSIFDPRRGETYDVQANEPPNSGLSTEDSVTQTAGIIYQTGKLHRVRLSLDFTDTQKTNELRELFAQDLVNLEAAFPERVTRQAAQPGDPGAAGRITSVLTGSVNAAERHSQNWSAAADYRYAEFFGGTLELRGRYFYFQKYDLKLFPTSPVVDELGAPDGAVPGLLRHRVNVGAGWFNRRGGLGLDGHYYHSRVLPVLERPSQGDRQIKAYTQWDAFVQLELARWLPRGDRYGLRAQVRVNNLFDEGYPRYVNDASGAGVQPYGDFRGRTFAVSLTATF